ncbi:MAG: HlyD family secretion protein [Coxiellaceae bacterium]|nr:HlyD family secretion protein [Coxiellaceae bacterium]
MIPKKSKQYALFAVIALIFILSGYAYWHHQRLFPSTDDAYVEGHVINIASQVNGKIQQVFVQNQQNVEKNQLLFTIDPSPFQIAYNKAAANLKDTEQQVIALQSEIAVAESQLAQRKAQLIDAQKTYDRITPLVKRGYYAKSGGDNATRQLAVAKQAVSGAQSALTEAKAKLGTSGDQNAQILSAKAMVAEAALNLQYTKVTAPSEGELAQLSIRPGQTVSAYQSLFSLITDRAWWATANMKETDLDRIRIGQPATIVVDMYPSHPFQGTVTSIGAGSGATFSLLPPENASGNWVKVTQRFPVRVTIKNPNPNFPLRMGASCTVTIDTSHEQ